MFNFIINKKVSLLFISIFAMLTIIACGSDDEMENETSSSAQMDEVAVEEVVEAEEDLISIAEIAVADGRFNTLVAALTAADLVDTLSGDGTFTVFAPTDDAFAALPEGMVDSLLADTETLTQVLLYHVVGDVVMAESVVELNEAGTLQGSNVNISVVDGKVFINESQVIITDIEANNGVIHVIDNVLMPELEEAVEEAVAEEDLISIAEIAVADGRFNTLVAALTAADLVDTLSGDGTFTVFAPTDDAFAALPEGTLDGLLADTDALTQVLLYHVVGDVVMAEQVVEVSAATTLQGTYVSVKVDDGKVYINDAQVIITDLKANNGVIHVIDQVLIPNLD